MEEKNNGGEALSITQRLQGIKHIIRNKSVTKDQPAQEASGLQGLPIIRESPKEPNYMDLADAITGSGKDEKV